MPPGGGGGDPAPAGASYHTGPHQVGFANLFHGGGFFADSDGEGGYSDWAAAVAFDEGGEDGTVEPVEAHGVHVEHNEGGADGLEVDVAGAVNVGVVADAGYCRSKQEHSTLPLPPVYPLCRSFALQHTIKSI